MAKKTKNSGAKVTDNDKRTQAITREKLMDEIKQGGSRTNTTPVIKAI